ncbi:MAG: topoisomerase DNA-binding C4 zinc finger domain-containing protein [Kiritimatiellales bacterium]
MKGETYGAEEAETERGRKKKNPAERIPEGPQCGKPMVLRTAKSGKNEGKQFWGCTGYPECKGTAKI